MPKASRVATALIRKIPDEGDLVLGRAGDVAGFEHSVCGVAHEHEGCTQPPGKRVQGDERPAQAGCTTVVDSIAIPRFAWLGSALTLTAFSAIAQMSSVERYKLFLRLRIGDGGLPKCAKMRQKAPFGGTIHGGTRSAQTGTFKCHFASP
jgi:hypothetical protein